MSWMSRNFSGHGRLSRSPLACRIFWALCDTNWNISRMLKRSAGLSCSFGLSSLSGRSGLFGLSRLFGFSGSSNKTNQIDQTNQTDQMNQTSHAGSPRQARKARFEARCSENLELRTSNPRTSDLSHRDAHEQVRTRPSATTTSFIRSLTSAHGRPSLSHSTTLRSAFGQIDGPTEQTNT